ncbi:MAG: MarR family transcriptional regulator [Loktanella sp.]|nr:MarR family transcriptional regulator [Loktanella sp.]
MGRAAHSETAGSNLTAAQWTCLRFFARANGSTRTPSCFASFQATTRGTASQIIKSLERAGLIARRPSEHDRRSVCFDLTDAGRTILEDDPLCDLTDVLDGLGRADRNHFLTTLSRLSGALAERRDVPAFGTCRDCSHFSTSGDAAFCSCMAAELAKEEITKLCGSYRSSRIAMTQGARNDAT